MKFRLCLFWRKTISGNDFTPHCVFGCTWKIKFSRKAFPLTVCFMALTQKMVHIFIFATKHFRVWRTKREREREKRSPHSLLSHTVLSILSHTHSSPIAHPSTGESSDHATNPPIDPPARSRHELINPPSEWPTSRLTHHLQIDPPRPPASRTDKPISLCPSLTIGLVILIFFVLIFVSCVVYIFWFSVIIFVWILRKCEKHDKKGFSRAFSAIQPNTKKYFPKHFLKCNQTLENIFLSQKYFTLENILHSENILYLTKRSLKGLKW